MTDAESPTLVVTGADAKHFANLRVLIGSWRANMRSLPLAVCNFGLDPVQVAELGKLPGVEVLTCPVNISHPWQGKSLIGRFLEDTRTSWQILMWIDADAFFAHQVPALPPLIDGYDMILDAHVQSVGEIVQEGNLKTLGLRPDDAYFSAGWWVARRGCLLKTYERLAALVQGQGNLWEGDAFVAAIYAEKLKLRTVSGSVWHARGKTSLATCTVHDREAWHAGQPIYIVHANDQYTTRPDGRRILNRPELAAIQDEYETVYRRLLGTS